LTPLLLPLALVAGCNASVGSDTGSGTQPIGRPGLVAAYGFDEGNGSVANDASGHGLNGTISGPTWTTGKFGGGLAFNKNLVPVPDANHLDFPPGFTLSAGVYPTATLQQWPSVIMKEKKPSQLAYALYANSDKAHPSAFFSHSNVQKRVDGGSALPLNTW